MLPPHQYTATPHLNRDVPFGVGRLQDDHCPLPLTRHRLTCLPLPFPPLGLLYLRWSPARRDSDITSAPARARAARQDLLAALPLWGNILQEDMG